MIVDIFLFLDGVFPLWAFFVYELIVYMHVSEWIAGLIIQAML